LSEEFLAILLNFDWDKDTSSEEGIHPVCMAIMQFIRSKLDVDMKKVAARGYLFWIYGIISALCKLLQKRPDLEFPRDLSRIKVVRRAEGEIRFRLHEIAIKIDVLNAHQVSETIKKLEEKTGKRVFICLDEVQSNDDATTSKFTFLKKSLRPVGVLAVASADSGSVEIFTPPVNPELSFFLEFPGFFSQPGAYSSKR
jgi:anti-anti-sigma regulatory factor